MSTFESPRRGLDEHDEDMYGTAEYPVFHPFGTWGDGYLVDASAEAALEAYSRWSGWITFAIFMLAINVRYVVLPTLTPGVALAMGWLTVVIVGAVARAYLLRNARRVRIRARAEDLVRWEVMKYGRSYLLRLHAGLLIFFLAMSLPLAFVAEGPDRWLIPLAAVAFTVFSIAKIARILRLDEPPGGDCRT